MDTLAQDLSSHLNFPDDNKVEEGNCSNRECDENNEESNVDFSFAYDKNDGEDNEGFSFICDENRNVWSEIFPLFNTDLLLDNDVVSGPCCEWSSKDNKSSTSSEPGSWCKKSNSTGSSKLGRVKEFVQRSSSDGRDTFVYLNHATAIMTSHKNRSDVKVTTSAEDQIQIMTMMNNKNKKNKSESFSAFERYIKIKAKEKERRRYLPIR